MLVLKLQKCFEPQIKDYVQRRDHLSGTYFLIERKRRRLKRGRFLHVYSVGILV
jgi:hypothetical protein